MSLYSHFYIGKTFCSKFLRCISGSNCIFESVSKMSSVCVTEIETLIFLDIETTGLPKWENNRTKITELCMVAVQSSHIRLGVFPRVQNKLSFCFNPWKLISADAEKLTGLSNNLLEHQCKLSAETVNSINSFLHHHRKPICFVGHNATDFDYPILRREIDQTGVSLADDLLCIDSIKAFRELYFEETNVEENEINNSDVPLEFTATYDQFLCDLTEDTVDEVSQKVAEVKRLNETTPQKQKIAIPSLASSSKKIKITLPRQRLNFDVSFKLGEVYTRLTKKPPINQHQAEGDVLMLITCAATLGDKFVNWANVNAKKFCDIPPMVPGKKIGS